MKKLLALLLVIPLVAVAETNKVDILDYVNRTAKDYCGKNLECNKNFSQSLIIAYKDGEKDSNSRYKPNTLLTRFEKKWQTLECTSAASSKDACYSMVDRLADAYMRGLNNG